MSMLLGTVNQIESREVLDSQEYAGLWQTIAAKTVVLLEKQQNNEVIIKNKLLNLHTLLMTTRQLVRLGNITADVNPLLWR